MLVMMSEALKRYFEENVVATAVDALASRKPSVPATLEWKDMDDFYQAAGAAHHVKVEYARFLNGIWEEVWGGYVEPARLSKPASTADSNQLLVDECWNEGSYGRCLVNGKGEKWLWLNIDVTRSSVMLSLSLDGSYTKKLLGLLDGEAGWRRHDSDWVSLDGGDPLSIGERLPDLKKAAGDAMTIVQPLQR